MVSTQNFISLNTLIDEIDNKPIELSLELQTGFSGCRLSYKQLDISIDDILIFLKDKSIPNPKSNIIQLDINTLQCIEKSDDKYVISTDDYQIAIKVA
jgi:hypothetical protein